MFYFCNQNFSMKNYNQKTYQHLSNTYYIETYGCQMNIADSEVVTAILSNIGYRKAESLNEADLILINTCSVRDNAEQRVWGRLEYFKSLKRKMPNLMVAVIGCMAERIGEQLLEHQTVDIVAGPDSYRELPLLIDKAKKGNKSADTNLSDIETYSGITPNYNENGSISGYTTIMRGCNNFCTYCIVPYTRGRERSRDPKDIINETVNMYKLGFREITLLGQNVNSYYWQNIEQTVDFPALIKQVANIAPDLRVRFTTSHPKDISDTLLSTIAQTKNICKHIHLPVQSGSNKILERMNRKYTREYYLERISKIREIIPDCSITTDIFCGFSGETDDDHQQTIDLIKTVRFDSAFMFKYSEREGTYAANHLLDDVPEPVKIERLNQIIKLQNSISKEKNQKEISKIYEVLVEGFSKKSTSDVFGKTSQNKVVVFPNNGFSAGDYVTVKIVRATSATLIAMNN